LLRFTVVVTLTSLTFRGILVRLAASAIALPKQAEKPVANAPGWCRDRATRAGKD
jgi:hypothetical protein